jgi:hypothetical protein
MDKSSAPPTLSVSAALALAHRDDVAGRMQEAERLYRLVLKVEPYNADALHLLGLLHYKRGDIAAAVPFIRQAIAIRPSSAEAHNNLGAALESLGQTGEAIASYARATALKPDFSEALNNLGRTLHDERKFSDAERCFRAALRVKADNPEVHANLSMLLLLTGRFEEGWKEFEWRRTVKAWKNRPHNFTQPLWNGEALADRSLLVSVEFGFGDTIQFCRYVPLVARFARVILEVQRPLLRLVSRMEGVEQVIAYGDPLPAFDLYCPLMSLPHVLGTTLATIPRQIPYLAADPARVERWRSRLQHLHGFRVGLSWAGNPGLVRDRQRSIALDRLAVLAAVPGVVFVSLQKGAAAAQIRSQTSGMVVHDWTDELEDFDETAALIETLDLVIGVDTSIVHLAGALGKPVWLLNRFDTCWRWLLDRDDSPWYPTLRQFRQPRRDDWDSVLGNVRKALEQATEESRRELIRPGTLAGSGAR